MGKLDIRLEPGAFGDRWGWSTIVSDYGASRQMRDVAITGHLTHRAARRAIPRTIRKLRRQQHHYDARIERQNENRFRADQVSVSTDDGGSEWFTRW